MNHPELSAVEVLVLNWLVKREIPFIPQQNLFGGTTERGGAKVDFLLTELNIIIRVQSYWHTLPEARARDEMQKIHLINAGYIVVDVQEEDIRENIGRVMSAAVRGEELHTNGV